MSQLNEGSDSEMAKSENEAGNSVWSEEHDRIPLKQRLKMLLASKRLLDITDTKTETQATSLSKPLNSNDIVVKKEYGISVSKACNSTYQVGKGRTEIFPLGQTHGGEVGETNSERVEEGRFTNRSQITDEVVNSAVSRVEEDNAFTTCPQQLMLSDCSVEVEPSDNDRTSSAENYASNSFGVNVQVAKVKPWVPVDSFDDLDYIALKERQRMLLSRKLLGQPKSVLEGIAPCSPRPVIENKIQCDVSILKGESHFCGRDCFDAGNSSYEINNASESVSSSCIMEGSYCTIQPCAVLALPCMGSELITSGHAINIQRNSKLCSSQKNYTNCEFSGAPNLAPRTNSIMLSSPISTIVNVKVEPSENNELQIPSEKLLGNSTFVGLVSVKREAENLEEVYENIMDHMLLSERIKLLAPREVPNLNASRNVERMGKLLPSAVDCTPVGSESTKPLKIVRYRKRKRTVTDSVETALEEDAPGLLQVLLDKGVSINEIKLYGETENDEPIDESFIEDSFSELETVIAKLFSQRQSLLKLAPIRCPKDDRACYCLACLFSLVEQARYLHFRNWPVEWGWCRDLQSFIFVFERHNRIVLERPEYGYATYFFELMGSLPVNWQIKRLVTTMKLTSCGRSSLIENKALMVGEDLTEGEARVLMEYGWIPNTGLGTMLNYCDRVVHDRKSERDSSEWRSKIGKLLMDGYNGGKHISTDVPEKVMECSGAEGMQIKLELK